MKYIGKVDIQNKYNDIENLQINLLKSKGVENPKDYINILEEGKKYENDYKLLDNIQEGVECLLKHIDKGSNIFTVCDPDCDGISSASILYLYLTSTFKDIKLKYQIHTGKQHGLSDDITVPEGTNLVIMTDASSNDYDQHEKLKEQGIDVLVIDHHQAERLTENAIIINNQLCNYPNKQLSGVGIVYKFLQALDDELWQNKADDYLDLVAFGLIGDSMNISKMETKYYIEKGLNNIKNKQLKALLKKQEYSTKGIVSINSIAFYISPLINGMIRVGKQDEKELMVKGFIEQYDEFDYKPRGDKPITKEDIYTRVARLCSNTKSRQDKLRDKALTEICNTIETKNKLNDKVLVINCNNKYSLGLTGVVAIKVASKYNRPCVLLNQMKNGEYRGSGRNTDNNDIKDLKALLNSTNMFNGVGHPQAMGVTIEKDIPKAIEVLNELLKDVEFSNSTYTCDFIIPFEELEDELIFQIDLLSKSWGKGLEEPLIAITDIDIKSDDIEVIGKKTDTLKISVDGVEFIKFKIDDNDKLVQELSDWDSSDNKTFRLDIVGKCSSNEFNGLKKPQIIITDYNITKIN